MQTLVNSTEGDFVLNGVRSNVGLSTFLQSIMVTENNTESIQKTEAIKFVVLICNHRTYNLPLNENWLHNLHSVTTVKPE
jgi:hypothetical protein